MIAYSKELQPLTGYVIDWAVAHILKCKGYATKHRVICLNCGNKFPSILIKRKRAVCPHCNKKLHIENTRKTTFGEKLFLGYAQIVEDYQVVRYFELQAVYTGGNIAEYFCSEVLQHWIKDNGTREIVAKSHIFSYYDTRWTGNLEIRKDRGGRGVSYDVYPKCFHPKSTIKSCYTKIGITPALKGITFLDAIRIIPENPPLETLLKAKQYNLLNAFSVRRLSPTYWAAIKICLRNKYVIKDVGMWKDYIDLLEFFNKDIHSTKYICPVNLAKEHDRYAKKKKEFDKRKALEERRKKLLEDEAKFKELKAPFLGVKFSQGDLTVKTLDSVEEYIEEGSILRHCVYTNEYYLKKGTLCLSARVKEVPVETIEISLTDRQILQCRGEFNKDSSYHKEIINLLHKNKLKIKTLEG